VISDRGLAGDQSMIFLLGHQELGLPMNRLVMMLVAAVVISTPDVTVHQHKGGGR
jgi:hypothetical protein